MLPRGNLRIGRVGLDVELNEPQFLGYRGTRDGRQLNISGYLRAETLEETQLLRNELIAQIGKLVTVAYDTDDTLNGAAIIIDADIDIRWTDGALLDPGYFRFELNCEWLGSFAELEYQSLLSMVSAAEDFGTDPWFWHSPPIGARAYSAGGNQPTLIERPTEDGPILVAYDIPQGTHPTWSVHPDNYYLGAVELWAGGYLRAGQDMPMDPADWEINGKVMKVRPGVTNGQADGVIEFAAHNGSGWGPWVPFQIVFLGEHPIPGWDFVTVLRNDAEAVTIRLVRDALEDNPSTAKHELDITVRRGGALVTLVYKFDAYTGHAGHAVFRADGPAAATRPEGASYISFDAAINGDQWVLGCPKEFTEDTTDGGFQLDNPSNNMPFFVAANVGSQSNDTGNGRADLARQFVGQVAESVRAVRR